MIDVRRLKKLMNKLKAGVHGGKPFNVGGYFITVLPVNDNRSFVIYSEKSLYGLYPDKLHQVGLIDTEGDLYFRRPWLAEYLACHDVEILKGSAGLLPDDSGFYDERSWEFDRDVRDGVYGLSAEQSCPDLTDEERLKAWDLAFQVAADMRPYSGITNIARIETFDVYEKYLLGYYTEEKCISVLYEDNKEKLMELEPVKREALRVLPLIKDRSDMVMMRGISRINRGKGGYIFEKLLDVELERDGKKAWVQVSSEYWDTYNGFEASWQEGVLCPDDYAAMNSVLYVKDKPAYMEARKGLGVGVDGHFMFSDISIVTFDGAVLYEKGC